MRIFWLFCALGALLGCRTVSEPSGTAIALFCSTYQGAKTESLTVGEEVAVFACPEGTEDYFLEAAKFLVGSDGRSLTYASTVYYPDPKQVVRFLAYFPFGGTWDKGQGTFSVPSDQSTTVALKQADLCGATASTTPVATPVALEFRHLMARVVITTHEPTTKISFPNALASGVLHAATAELVLGTAREDIWTDKNEFIVPVQPLTRLVLTVADTVLGVISKVEYVLDTAPIALEAGKTTTLNLTLHPNTKTATLSGSSVTDWVASSTEGNLTQAVSNVFTVHWPNYLLQGATPDRVVFTIGGTDYTVSSEISYANRTFIVPFASSALRYPYAISKIDFYQSDKLAQSCNNLLGSMIYKAGTSTIGIKDLPPNAVLIKGLWWATGNLVASNATVGKHGLGGCQIGEPADGGLYFQFGSLIGWKGGNQKNGGTGIGIPQHPLTTDGTYWGGAAVWNWENEAMVWPAEMVDNPTSWPQATSDTAHKWYFSGQGVISETINSTDAVNGVGDPCSYYLGGTWRLPTTDEEKVMCNDKGGYNIKVDWELADALWDPLLLVNGGKFAGKKLFFPASGYRYNSNGSFTNVTMGGYGWSSSVYNAEHGLTLSFNRNVLYPQNYNHRSLGFPVRCVSE